MTQPAAAIGQQLIAQLTVPLQRAADNFATTVSTSLTREVEKMTASLKAAQPAVTQATGGILDWMAATNKTTSTIAQFSGNLRDMIKNPRELREQITKLLDAFPVLDGLRLRMWELTDTIKKNTLEALRNTAAKARDAITTRVVAAAKAVWNAITRVVTVAMRALNLVMRMNPIGLVVTALMLLIGGLVLAYQRSTTFRNIVNAAFGAVRTVAIAVFNAIRNAVAVVWPYIQRVIQIVVTVIRAYVTTYFTIVRTVVTAVFTAVRNVVTAVWPYIQRVIQVVVTVIRAYVTTYFTIVRTVVTTIFNAVRAVVTTVWNGIRSVVTGAVSAVVSTVRRVQQVYNTVRDAFNRARTAVGDAISGVVTFVRGLPGRVVDALGNIGRTLYNSGKDLIMGFINGLRDAAGRIVSAIKDFVLDKIPGPIKSFLGISSPSRLMAGIGQNIGEGLVVGIDDSRDMVEDAMSRLVPAPRAAVIRPAVAGLAQATLAGVIPGAGAVAPRRAPGGAAETVTVNVYPRAGQSEYEIGQVAARELAWAAKS